ncbi:MAG TPA: ATP-binding protein, partial [Candidatus Limnocylindria bacterium]|nr:ATP-binding protein [Candidatus Limnocylindria bacterium]
AERRSNELRDAFNGIISHELRTPITAIYGGAKLLSRRSAETKDQTTRELIHDIEAEADRLYRLVEDLLVLARSERGTLEAPDEPVLLPRVVERLIQSERGRWRDRRFHVDIAGPVPAGHGEETYVEQVLRNLLDNAAKYSPDDTPISVVVDADSDVVRVRVLDEGPGIALAEARQLFELYYRSPDTTRMAGGAGIGLFVSRALIEAMGGRIWAARRPEGGSEFGFQLRRYEVDHEHAPEAAKHSGEPAAAASVAGKQP